VSGTALGALLAAAGLVPLLATSQPRLRLAGFVAWTLGIVVLAADLLHSPISRFRVDATDHPPLAAGAILAAIAFLVVGGWLVQRWPWLLLLGAVLAAPARIPVHAGGADANLLVFLYAVIAAGWAATAWELLRGAERAPELGRLGQAAAALVGWMAISVLWTADTHQAGVEMLFFVLPFAFLLARLGALRPGLRELRWAFIAQVALGLVFTAVGAYQHLTHHVFWNPKIIVANDYAAFFRVNSLFWDASIYGRFLAVTIVLLAAVCIYRGFSWWLIGLIAVLFGGMYLAYSQSSLLALAAGCLFLGATVWPRRATIVVLAVTAVAGAVALVVALGSHSANSVSSDRSHLLDLGKRVIRHHPFGGAGMGGFARAALEGTVHPGRVGSAASHTTPVTVLAELGPVGLALYVWLLFTAFVAGLMRPLHPLRLALLAALVVILAHSLFYNAFFEDPATWILLALLPTVTTTPASKAAA